MTQLPFHRRGTLAQRNPKRMFTPGPSSDLLCPIGLSTQHPGSQRACRYLRHLKSYYFTSSTQVDDRKGVRCHPWLGIGIRELWRVSITRLEHFHPTPHLSLHR